MPRIAESLRNAGYLQNLTDAIGQLIQKGRAKEDQNQYNQMMMQAADQIRKNYSTQPEETAQFMNLPNGVNLPAKSKLGVDLLQQLKPTQDKTMGVTSSDIEEPQDLVLGDATGAKYGTMSREDQNRRNLEILANTLLKSNEFKNINQGDVSKGKNALELLMEAYSTPEKKLRQFDPEKDIYEIDSNGNLKIKQKGTPQKNVKAEKSIGSYTGADGKHYITLYDPNSQTTREIASEQKVRPPKGTTIKMPKPEKWKDLGAYINSIYYKTDPKTNKIVETTPEEQQVLMKQVRNISMSNMLPGAIDWYKKEIVQKWNADNISQADFEREIEESLIAGELTAEEAQDLIDYNSLRPLLHDQLRPIARESAKYSGE